MQFQTVGKLFKHDTYVHDADIKIERMPFDILAQFSEFTMKSP